LREQRIAAADEPATAGRDHYAIAWRLTAAAWLACAILQFLLYVRPSPYGGPFMIQWKVFIVRPLVYEMLATWLIALPFLLLWLVLWRRALPSPRWRIAHWLLIALMTVNLLLTQFDHEVYRFLGLRLGPSFLEVYLHPRTMGDSLFLNVLRGDRGGPFLAPILCFGAPALYLWWSARMVRRRTRSRPPLRFGLRVAAVLLILPLATGCVGWSLAKARFRLSRMEPTSFAMIREFKQSYGDEEAPGDVASFARQWQAEWQAASTDRNWRFSDPRHPFLRVPTNPSVPAAADKWNVIIIQLETVRGNETGDLMRDGRPSPTPYMDSLAQRPDAAIYTRAVTFGPPSINGRFATQCSLIPSSRRFITSHTHVATYCLADALRRQGYRAEFFSAGDIDMDNSTVWVQRMYDILWRYPEIGQVDRPIYRRAAERIRELGRQGPFLATLTTASNHHPFRSLEPQLDVAGQATVHERIRNTIRYTDDVVREFVESLRSEPWFGRTLVLINSDHGYNLGEHDGLIGGFTLYRESVWTPFLILGAHPRLPVGRHDEIVTLNDIAPTIADLIGLREPVPWQGHSLLALNPARSTMFGFRESLLVETPGWTALRDPHDGRPHLYDARTDWLQRRDLAARHPAMVARALAAADRSRRFQDYLIRQDRIWPRTRSAQR
jgi:arylsulfatase A-like enzyme